MVDFERQRNSMMVQAIAIWLAGMGVLVIGFIELARAF
jgi:hypothetical protein